MLQLQQGDVLIQEIKELPKGLNEMQSEGGRYILVHGEATGHHHSVPAKNVRVLVADRPGVLFLEVMEPTTIEHQEHKSVELKPAYYEISQVQEYDYFAEAARWVMD